MRRKCPGFIQLKNPVKFVCVIISVSFVIIQIISALQLGKISISKDSTASFRIKSNTDQKIGKLGEMVIKMLPEDLVFTLFLPSEEAFKRELRLNPKESFGGEKANDTYAILTRVLGFSAVPMTISSADLPYGKEIVHDSISGFNLYILKDSEGKLLVNRVVSEHVDLKFGDILVHLMDGVIMDSEFEESVQPIEEEIVVKDR